MDDQFNPQPRPQTAKRTKINNDASISDASFSVSARQFAQGDLPGLSSASAVTESSLDVNFDSGDTSLLVPQQRGMDVSSGELTGFNENVDESREFSFVELVQVKMIKERGQNSNPFHGYLRFEDYTCCLVDG